MRLEKLLYATIAFGIWLYAANHPVFSQALVMIAGMCGFIYIIGRKVR